MLKASFPVSVNLDLLIPLLITTVVAIIGWYVAHGLNMRRDREAKRRELQLQFFIDAYRRIESVTNRSLSPESGRVLESATTDIQLFGTANQVRLVQEFVTTYAENRKAPIQPLLNALRDDLRRELDLEVTSGKLRALRIEWPADEQARVDGNDT